MSANFKTFLILLLVAFASCSQEQATEESVPPNARKNDVEAPKEVPEKKRELTMEERVETKNWPRLSNENCVEFLTAYGKSNSASKVVVHTDYGDIQVRLFDDTPLHRANFLYQIERDYFAPTQIVRIVPDFVVQGGNSEEPIDQEERFLIGEYTIPNEISAGHRHFRGALAMSRSYEENPDKRSAPYDFYFVDGKKVANVEFFQVQQESGIAYSGSEERHYKEIGGAPHLDGEHTVFGEVVSGMDVIEKITTIETDASEWPVIEVVVSMEVVE